MYPPSALNCKPGASSGLIALFCGLKGRHIQLLPGILGMPQLDGRGQLRRGWTTACEESMRCGCDLSLAGRKLMIKMYQSS